MRCGAAVGYMVQKKSNLASTWLLITTTQDEADEEGFLEVCQELTSAQCRMKYC